ADHEGVPVEDAYGHAGAPAGSGSKRCRTTSTSGSPDNRTSPRRTAAIALVRPDSTLLNTARSAASTQSASPVPDDTSTAPSSTVSSHELVRPLSTESNRTRTLTWLSFASTPRAAIPRKNSLVGSVIGPLPYSTPYPPPTGSPAAGRGA